MAIPADVEEKYRHAELLMCLPPNWPVSDEAFRDPRFGWPVRSLKFLARYPHAYSTWLVAGHTIPNGNPPAPLAPGTQQVALMLSFPILLGEDVHQLTTASGRVINFWSVISLYAEELELKLSEGTDALIERLGTAGLCDIVHPARPNVAAPRNPAGT